MTIRILGAIVGAMLGLLALSYLVGDNPLYRMALHIFAGLVIGYTIGIVVREILIGMALPGLLSNPRSAVIPIALGLLLLFKGLPRFAFVGNTSMAYLVGVGTAAAIGGAALGTLVPQVRATARTMTTASLTSSPLGPLDGLMVVLGTICTLFAFTFTVSDDGGARFGWKRIVGAAGQIGRLFLIFALGVAFAGVVTSSLSIFIGQLQAFLDLALLAFGL